MTKPTVQSLLTHDLETRSAGSSGRALLDKLEDYCLDLLDATRPLEFAQRLESTDPHARRVLEELLEWTAQERAFQLVALVALAPDLDRVARQLGHGRPSADTVAEVLVQASQALCWTYELVEGERADFVRRYAFMASKGEQRRMSRHNVLALSFSDDFDWAEVSSGLDVEAKVDQRLRFAHDRGVISSDERQVIELTRGGTCSLRALAQASTASYDALRVRRSRAESRLRAFYGIVVVE